MNPKNKFYRIPWFESITFGVFFLLFNTQYACADLVSSMTTLQGNVTTICQPLAIIFLIVAGWQKAMGNAQLFILALIGTVVMFAAPQLVNFISSAFGN
jgi:type IV secretory pathway VirB2 component (pilin)